MELLDAATVIEGDGNWMGGGLIDNPGCSLQSFTSPVCEPDRRPLTNETVDGATPEVVCQLESFPFAVITQVRFRGRDLDIESKRRWVKDAMDAEAEKAAASVFWEGDAAMDGAKEYASLASTSVHSATAGTDGKASIVAALEEFRQWATGAHHKDTLLHLGYAVLLEADTAIDDNGRLKGTSIRVVSSPGYPSDGIALTGPVTIRRSSIQDLGEINTANNDRETAATQFVSVEFDPCYAVLVG